MPEILEMPEHLAADVAELTDLLALLPDPDREAPGYYKEWWAAFATTENAAHERPADAFSMCENFTALRHPEDAEGARRLAEHALTFFDKPSPDMLILLGSQLGVLHLSAARLAESIAAAAWRIYVPLQAADRRREALAAATGEGDAR